MTNPSLRLVNSAILLLCFLGSGCGFAIDQTKGSGTLATEKREVAGFSSLSLRGAGKVSIKQTGKESLTITAEDNLLPLFETVVVDGKLILSTKDKVSISPTKPIEYVIEIKGLSSLEISGSGQLDARDLDAKGLEIALSGAGSVSLSGNATELSIGLSGAGSIQGEDLKTKKANVDVSGAGSAVVNVSESLDVTISGAGSVTYLGDPTVKKSISGVGSVKKR